MAQVGQPGNLDRWDNPAYRLITVILMRCGLRVSDATKLPFDCIACDADGAPYLRYCNRKMKREALVPIDDELRQQLLCQQQVVLQRWPAGVPVLFPRVTGNLRGDQPQTVASRRLTTSTSPCSAASSSSDMIRVRAYNDTGCKGELSVTGETSRRIRLVDGGPRYQAVFERRALVES